MLGGLDCCAAIENAKKQNESRSTKTGTVFHKVIVGTLHHSVKTRLWPRFGNKNNETCANKGKYKAEGKTHMEANAQGELRTMN